MIDDDRQMRMPLPYAGQEVDPIHFRHANIGDHQIRGVVRQPLQRLLAVSSPDYAMPLLFEKHGKELADRLLIINNQDLCHYVTPQ